MSDPKEITITFNADTSDLDAALERTTKKVRKLQKAVLRQKRGVMFLRFTKLISITGLGCFGYLLAIALSYAISVMWWSWLLMLAMGIWGPHGSYQWSYVYTCTHWGLLTPFVLA